MKVDNVLIHTVPFIEMNAGVIFAFSSLLLVLNLTMASDTSDIADPG